VAERREIRLDDHDVLAAAQILSWIARPHRPESGMKVLNHWYVELQRDRGKVVPDLPFNLMRRNRIEAQFRRLEADCLIGFRAGTWLNWKILSAAPGPWLGGINVSTRELGRRRASARQAKPENETPNNEIRSIWSKRKPVAHLALAAANSIGARYAAHDLRGFGLSWTILNPDWVADALARSEDWFRSASRHMDADQFYRFHRDTF
jgi:hypothetical protein